MINVVEWLLKVTGENTTKNVNIKDVIGNKNDDEDGDSLYAEAYIAKKHMHAKMYIYPELAPYVVATSHTTAYTYGDYVEIVPADTITLPFDVHYADVDNMDTTGEYVIEIAKGTVGNEEKISCFSVNRSVNKTSSEGQPIQNPIMPANTRICARVAHSVGGGAQAGIKVAYHEY